MNNKDSVAPEFSQAALERRLKFGIAMDQKDLELNPSNLEALASFGTFVFQSRWLNMQSLECPSNMTDELQALPFVSNAYCKKYASFNEGKALAAENKDFESHENAQDSEELLRQTAHLEAHEFKKRGLNGKGVRIAVLDIGFKHADQLAELQHLKIIKSRDFITKRSREYKRFSHGTSVLACIGGLHEGTPLGLATEAEILLAKTERAGEYLVEEESWLAAVEWADLEGADIVHSSLGYTWQRYWTEQMDGRTSLVSRAAALASSKGLLVITSAGNEGEFDWRIISAPADSDSVLAVGAINPESGLRADYSSFGPTADKRVKPDVMAYGSCFVPTPNGLRTSQGTSFAAPLISGFAACLLQHNPNLNPAQMRQLIRQSAHLYPYFDYAHGYGIPKASKLFTSAISNIHDSLLSAEQSEDFTYLRCRMLLADSGQFNPEDPSNFLFYHIANSKGELLSYKIVMPHRAVLRDGDIVYESVSPDSLMESDRFNPLKIEHSNLPPSCILRATYMNQFVEININ